MVSAADVVALRAQVSGQVLLPGEPGHDIEAFTFNLLTPLNPAVVVAASSPQDVQAAVRFAADNALGVAVRGGGHVQPDPASSAVLITLDAMNSVVIEPETRTARITGTPRWQDVLDATSGSGLAPVCGSAPTVGVVGYLLGGGQSPVLGRSHGYGSDHVTRIEMVTADGELQVVTAEHELFFALRGSKGNLGVVTAVEFTLFPVSEIYGGGLYLPGERLAEILPAWRDWAETLPEAASTSVAIQRLPPLPDLPPPLQGAFVVHIRFSYVGDAGQGAALLAPMRDLGPALIDTVGVMPYAAVGAIHSDPALPVPYCDRSIGLRELSDQTLNTLIGLAGPDSDCPLASVELRALGGALDRPPAQADAVSSRGLAYQWFAFGVGGPEDAPGLRAYLARCIDELTPWADERRLLTFLSPDEGGTRDELSAIYGPEVYERLLIVKQKYDPQNMFRSNHNILA
ncbi:FAD-binding oxidoreductase [Kineosporia babensis]|uniref:FAD-binding protein n=1 Tax=Kineosporia babensis TaxID=499548 RepID=A0A9X1SW66_9ACTN|nr:FAD-binding protein [Kineosporia babensis]MCD5314426.1 FAD-binding protein [Kineosporia babensis]